MIEKLLKIVRGSTRLITTTSRPPRPEDQDGKTYYFLSEKDFKYKIEAGDFLEHNYYAGNYYGTEKKVLETALENNEVIFSKLDVNGKRSLDKLGIKHMAIFLLPESLEQLKHRIEQRGGLTPEKVAERLKIAASEIKEASAYDFRVINVEGKLTETAAKIAKIIHQHRFLLTLDKVPKVG